jgi:hypothetical protein
MLRPILDAVLFGKRIHHFPLSAIMKIADVRCLLCTCAGAYVGSELSAFAVKCNRLNSLTFTNLQRYKRQMDYQPSRRLGGSESYLKRKL